MAISMGTLLWEEKLWYCTSIPTFNSKRMLSLSPKVVGIDTLESKIASNSAQKAYKSTGASCSIVFHQHLPFISITS
jgi:hypothetical protein